MPLWKQCRHDGQVWTGRSSKKEKKNIAFVLDGQHIEQRLPKISLSAALVIQTVVTGTRWGWGWFGEKKTGSDNSLHAGVTITDLLKRLSTAGEKKQPKQWCLLHINYYIIVYKMVYRILYMSWVRNRFYITHYFYWSTLISHI